jgi:hypothetical protein
LRTHLFAVHPELRLARCEATIPAVGELHAALVDPSRRELGFASRERSTTICLVRSPSGSRVT